MDFDVELWLEPSMKRPVDIYVPSQHLESVTLYLQQYGIEYIISISDVGKLIAEQMSTINPKQNEMNWDDYQRYSTV